MEQGSVPRRLGFIGCGQMARALANGFRRAGKASAGDFLGSDVVEAARLAFAQETGGRAVSDNRAVAANSDVLILAVKPQVMAPILAELQPSVTPAHLVISIAAGIPLAALAAGLGSDRRLVRVMPNTPCLVGASASGFALGGTATDEDAAYVESLLGAVGVAFRLSEPLLDAVTGLSGSGPAFVYLVIEALSDGGVAAGLPRPVATALAAQTVLGAARMALETGKHPGELKDMVASPAGTTIAGLAVLERGAVRGAFIDAVSAAARRATELGRLKS